MKFKTIILTGPSAIGKTYLCRLLISQYPDFFEHAHVYTTRPKRENENLIALERVFITNELFDEKVSNGDFIIFEEFAGYKYGYTSESFTPKNKHLLVDVSPWQIPKLINLKVFIILGLQAPKNFKEILNNRMKSRGDSKVVRKSRNKYIEKDINDLRNIHTLINTHGKVFTIKNDTTIPDEVVPFIVRYLGL